MLEDLHDPEVRKRLVAIWNEPASLDPAARAARVTRDIADLLATVARRLEKRGHTAERTSGFLMRLLFTMFAEDSGLIPEKSFTNLLKAQRAAPQHLEHQLTDLWAAMDRGEFSPALGVPLKRFNGYPKRRESAMRSTTADALEYARNWWLFAKGRPNMRAAVYDLDRCIVTSEVSKHPNFVFSQTANTQFDGSLIVIAHADAFILALLSSRVHAVWKLAAGGTLEDRPRYQLSNCFDPFPFPVDVPEPLKARIRAEAESLDALRKRVLAEHPDLTLTKLYNVVEALRVDRALTPQERDVHDRGLVTLTGSDYRHCRAPPRSGPMFPLPPRLPPSPFPFSATA